MRPAPKVLDGAVVAKTADLSDALPTGATRHNVNGQEATDFAALAIASYEQGGGTYLFYCDADWNVVTDTYHDTLEGAIAQAEFEFGGVVFVDLPTAG